MSNVIDMPERRRRISFAGGGRHRRTPETWARMEEELAAAKAAAATAKRDLEWSQQQVEGLKEQVNGMGLELRRLFGEVRQMRALMAADPDHPANQDTITVLSPAEAAEESTQPISRAELFSEDPMDALRPKVRVYDFEPEISKEKAEALLNQLSGHPLLSTVQPITPVVPLWKSPGAQSFSVVARTA